VGTTADARLQLIFAAKNLASPEVNKLHRELMKLNSGATGLAKGGLKSVAGGLMNLAKVGLVGAIAGFAALTGAIGAGISALKDQAKIDAQTAAVIKSTGGAAKVTAKHVDELANAIKDYSGVDDDAIKKGENMLLTFTEIRNGVGKNNQVFDRATKILVDMSVAMGADPQKQAVALGKALNDPVKGVTALTKVGVTFTDQQKKNIAAMVKSGNTAGAQTIILKELEREFGGSAKAVGDSADGAWNKLQNAVGDLTKQLASYFMPAFTTAVTFLTTTVVPAVGKVIDTVAAWVSANQPLIQQIGRLIVAYFTPLFQIIGHVAGALAGGKGGGKGLIATAIELGSTIFTFVVPKVQAFIETLTKKGGVIDSILGVVGPIVEKMLPALGEIAHTIFDKLLPAIGDLVGALWGDGTGPLAVAVKAIATIFTDVLLPAVNFVLGVISGVISTIKDVLVWLGILKKQELVTIDPTALKQSQAAIASDNYTGPHARGGPFRANLPFFAAPNESLMMATGGGYVIADGGAAARQRGADGGSSQPIVHVYLNGRRVHGALDSVEYYDLATQAPTLSRA
jgi:hypothetical protein